MKVRIFKQDNGLNTVGVKRTLPKENPSRAVKDVPDEEVEQVVARLCSEMRVRQGQ